jgi:prepilin peptidase CpaA
VSDRFIVLHISHCLCWDRRVTTALLNGVQNKIEIFTSANDINGRTAEIKLAIMNTDNFLILLLGGVLLLAAIYDRRSHVIPNLLTYPTMLIGLAYHCFTNGLDGFLFSAGGLALGIGIFILPYVMGGMGAGDAKLMGAVGSILGPRGVFIAFLFSGVVGGVYALILLLIKHEYGKEFIGKYVKILKTFIYTGQFVSLPASKKEGGPKLPYGIAIALGTLLYVFLQLSGYEFPV